MQASTPVILVTGAARRVGAAIARCLHAAGASVVVHHHTSRRAAEQLSEEFNRQRAGSALSLAADLCQPAQLENLVAGVMEHYGRLDALVNNASAFYATPLGRIDESAWDALVGSNLKGPLFLSQAAAPHLRARHGAIINLTDIHAERPLKNYALYCAAKAGLLGLTRALALELAPEVRVNAIAPGPIDWPEGRAGADFDADTRAGIIERTLLQRQGSPEDIARTARFLLFDAPYITGQVINVDGGRSIHL
ncbi:Pteridine reductase [Sterolibacterium denitrificans]|uniref:Pteridine reductase n=2 Tax=Sterolibacterium denitrificans TaxID=157592 RepID=A0A7Z7HTK1_9PROT|nr:pteridine reductase [Sterolibacterium denitrificans]KYC29445.1 pteridine reductase [Sterolibacterium denitrificans]SMB31587.1 Pteridine reductase [Sterolibacterium denitrificans]